MSGNSGMASPSPLRLPHHLALPVDVAVERSAALRILHLDAGQPALELAGLVPRGHGDLRLSASVDVRPPLAILGAHRRQPFGELAGAGERPRRAALALMVDEAEILPPGRVVRPLGTELDAREALTEMAGLREPRLDHPFPFPVDEADALALEHGGQPFGKVLRHRAHQLDGRLARAVEVRP